MESIKFQTAHEYDASNWVHVFHMRMPINGNMIYATTRVTEEYLEHGKEHAVESIKYELAYGIANEIRKQAEQFLAGLSLYKFDYPPDKLEFKPKPSNHATGSAADVNMGSIIKYAYQEQIAQQILDAKTYEKLKAQFMSKPDTHYEDHATSEFKGVEGLDESLWKDGTDGLI